MHGSVRVLAVDAGGTSTRLHVYGGHGPEPIHSAVYASRDYSGLHIILADFMKSAGPVEDGVVAIAGPVIGGRCEATNLPWVVEEDDLTQAINAPVHMINDFEAVGHGVKSMTDRDLQVLAPGYPPGPHDPIVVIGAGTGLGQSVVVPMNTGAPRVLHSEGGHTDFAPRNDEEVELLQWLREKHERVSVERVVSGQGLVELHRFLVLTERISISPQVEELLEREKDPGKVIGEAALAGTDAGCSATVARWLSLYGAEAGNLALKVIPDGGIYLAGGISAKLAPLFESSDFMNSFLHKGRMRTVLERVRVNIVLNQNLGIIGARNLALNEIPDSA